SLFSEIKQQVPVLYHICGDNSTVDADGREMLQIVASTGADAYDFDTQVDLELARQKIGPKPCIRGNTNTQILGNVDYSIHQVIQEVERTMMIGLTIRPYMYAAGCEWPWAPRDLAFRNLSAAKALCDHMGSNY